MGKRERGWIVKTYEQKLGINMKILRSNIGIKQKEMAKKLNISPSILSYYEKGKRKVYMTILNKFCKICNVKLSDLFKKVEKWK